MFHEPTTWVAVSFAAFVALIFYYKIPGKIAEALDKRAAAIRSELEEARRIREEAQSILADYQRKQREAEKNAEDIVIQAKKEAEALAAETRTALQESLERRTKLAEEKIERAEAQALAEIRSTTVDVAVAAASKIIDKNVGVDTTNNLINQTISDIKNRMN